MTEMSAGLLEGCSMERARKTGKYLEVQIKRVLRFFPTVLLITLLMGVAVALVGGQILAEKLSGEKQKKLAIGVVGDTSDSYLGIGIYALKQLDSSRFAMELLEMDEAQAKRQLLAGELNAYLVVPDGFVDSVVSGENKSIACYTGTGQAGLGVMAVREFAQVVSELVVKSQNGIYGMQSIGREYGLEQDRYWDATNELNLKYIDFVLSRTDIYELETLGVSQGLSTQGYYVCGFVVLFLLIWGVNGCPLFVRRDMSMANLLAADGRGPLVQVLCEYAAYLLMMAASLLCVAALLGGTSEFLELSIPEWKEIDFSVIFSFAVKLLPVTAMLTAMALLGHELVTDCVSGVLLQFFVAIVFGYLSGCLYPSSFFPQVVQRIGAILPSGVAVEYGARCMKEASVWSALLPTLIYLLLFLAGTWMLRRRKLQK